MHLQVTPQSIRLSGVVAWLFVGYVVYRIINSYVARRRFERFAILNGCEEPAIAENRIFWGLDRLYRILTFKSRGEDLLDDIVVQNLDQYGNTLRRTGLFNLQVIETREPINIQAVLSSNFKDFEIGQLRHKSFAPLLGKGIFTSDGADWEHYRALFRPHFSKANVNDLESTEEHVQAFYSVLPKIGSDGWTSVFDFKPLAYNFTLDAATSFFLGESVHSQAGGRTKSGSDKNFNEAAAMAADGASFAREFEIANNFMTMRTRLTKLYFLCDSPRFRKSVNFIKGWVDIFVQKALEEEKLGKGSDPYNEDKNCMLSSLVKETQDPDEIRDQILAALGAGRDTTAALLSFAMYELALHPNVYQRLREHVLADIPLKTPVSLDALRSCRYLQWILNETLRVNPPVPVNSRIAVRDTVLPAGGGPDRTKPVAVKKGTAVFYVPYAVHKRKDLWGEDADIWRPERWDGRKADWAFIPFNKGPRICLGQQYALTEAGCLLARIAQRFDRIEAVGLKPKIERGFGLVMFPKDPVNIRLHEAS